MNIRPSDVEIVLDGVNVEPKCVGVAYASERGAPLRYTAEEIARIIAHNEQCEKLRAARKALRKGKVKR